MRGKRERVERERGVSQRGATHMNEDQLGSCIAREALSLTTSLAYKKASHFEDLFQEDEDNLRLFR